MTVPLNDTILHQPISDLELSDEFKTTTKNLGYSTFAQLLTKRSYELSTQPGFTLALVYEYVEFLELRGLGELVDP